MSKKKSQTKKKARKSTKRAADRKLRVGVIGWMHSHESDIATTVAACDTAIEKAQKFADKHPWRTAYTDYREMGEKEDLDAVIISTPNWFHTEMAEHFLKLGVHVFVEKPMGVNKAECDRLLKTQKKSGKICAIDFEMRRGKAMQRIREIIDSGEIGDLHGIEFVHHRGGWNAAGPGAWRTLPEKSGGLFFMEICHEIDAFRYLAGEITHVQSFSHSNLLPQYPSTMPDNVNTVVWFESGMKAIILSTHTLSAHCPDKDLYDEYGHDMRWIITCTNGAIRFDEIRQKFLVVQYEEFHPDREQGRRVVMKRIEDYTGLPHMNHDIRGHQELFLQTIYEGGEWHQPLEDAWRTHLVCLAAEKSAIEDSQKIKVQYKTGKTASGTLAGR